MRVWWRGLLAKELGHFFLAPVAWLTMAAFAFVNGFVFLFLFRAYQGMPNEPLVRVFFGSQNAFFWVLQLIVIPAITMRLVAEERSSGTIELLLTAPVTEAEVVFAKFAAACAFYAVLWLPTLVLLGSAFYYACPEGFFAGLWAARAWDSAYAAEVWQRVNAVMDLGPVLAAYGGTFLMGAAWIAIGLLASSFCTNQVVAFITAFVALLTLFAVGFLEALIEVDPAWLPGLRDGIRFVSFPNAFDGFPRGVVDTRAVVYFLTLTALGLFLSVRVLESRRWR